MSARRRLRAFTLIEMIVAAILLAIGVVAALACIGVSTRATGIAAEYTTAAMLAQQHLAELEAQPDQITGGEQQGDFGDDHAGYSWSQQVETTDLMGVYKVTLTVDWRSGSGRRSTQFVTYEQTQAQAQTEPAGQAGG